MKWPTYSPGSSEVAFRHVSGVVIPALFVGEDGTLWRARTLERPRWDGQPTRLLVRRGRRLEVIAARYSERREPGTWHRLEAAS
jgi:hypothetical protein